MSNELDVYLRGFDDEGIGVVCRAMNRQRALTSEMQENKMFGDWEGTVGAAETAAYAAIVAYKDILSRALADLAGEEGDDGGELSGIQSEP